MGIGLDNFTPCFHDGDYEQLIGHESPRQRFASPACLVDVKDLRRPQAVFAQNRITIAIGASST